MGKDYKKELRDIADLAKNNGKLELINKVRTIALEEYNTDPKYVDDFCISIRDLEKLI